jgi:hypothetical protein
MGAVTNARATPSVPMVASTNTVCPDLILHALEIEEHEIQANSCRQQLFPSGNCPTLENLNFYSDPLWAVVQAVRLYYLGCITTQEACEVMKKTIGEYSTLHVPLETKYDGETASPGEEQSKEQVVSKLAAWLQN